jgi:hypothetical protein
MGPPEHYPWWMWVLSVGFLTVMVLLMLARSGRPVRRRPRRRW